MVSATKSSAFCRSITDLVKGMWLSTRLVLSQSGHASGACLNEHHTASRREQNKFRKVLSMVSLLLRPPQVVYIGLAVG